MPRDFDMKLTDKCGVMKIFNDIFVLWLFDAAQKVCDVGREKNERFANGQVGGQIPCQNLAAFNCNGTPTWMHRKSCASPTGVHTFVKVCKSSHVCEDLQTFTDV